MSSLTVSLVELHVLNPAFSTRTIELDLSLATIVTFAIVHLSAGFVRTHNKDSAAADTSKVTAARLSGALIMKLPLC